MEILLPNQPCTIALTSFLNSTIPYHLKGRILILQVYSIYCSKKCPSLLDSEGEGEGGMIWENDILTCILSSELNRQSMSDAGCSMLGAGAWG